MFLKKKEKEKISTFTRTTEIRGGPGGFKWLLTNTWKSHETLDSDTIKLTCSTTTLYYNLYNLNMPEHGDGTIT